MAYRSVDLVKQLTTTVGTGDFVLSASLLGFRDFSVALDVADCFVYEAHVVDGAGARTGVFEIGIGQYFVDTGIHKIRRSVILNSSNVVPATPVDFAAGSKHVYITVGGAQAAGLKVGPTLDGFPVRIYVRAGGNDSNSGFGADNGSALATLQAAVDLALSGFSTAMIDIGPGVFAGANTWSLNDVSCNIALIGAGRASTTIGSFTATPGVSVTVFDVLVVSASEVGLIADGYGALIEVGGYDDFDLLIGFGACPAGHVLARMGGQVRLGDYRVQGGCSAGAHLAAYGGGVIDVLGEHTLGASVTMAGGWAKVDRGLGYINFENDSFVLGGFTVTGPRYDVRGNGVVYTGGRGATYLPGSVAGSVATGGQYL